MNKLISMAEARKKFPQLFKDINVKKNSYILIQKQQPSIVVMSYEEYLTRCSREEVKEHFNKLWAEVGKKNARFSEEEIELDVKQAIKERRQKRKK
jgi:PHD/YefM family antitoxin component YafN of YafNO toxin-antitoxin module